MQARCHFYHPLAKRALGSNKAPSYSQSMHQKGSQQSSTATANVEEFYYKDRPMFGQQCGETVAEGLQDDPTTIYYSYPFSRKAFYKHALRAILTSNPDTSIASCENGASVAMFYKYPQPRTASLWQLLVSGGFQVLLTVKPNKLSELLTVSDLFDAKRDKFLREHGPFYYILFIGTKAHLQGQGLGTTLLQYITDKADQDGCYTYLEATSSANSSFYARRGFSLLEVCNLPPSAPEHYLMCRAPRAQTAKAAMF